MRNELSLLDRMDNASESSSYSLEVNWAKRLDNVSKNLQAMLNVRKGSVKALPDYGMPDFNDVVEQFPDAIDYVKQEIATFIRRYEPRLSQLSITYLADPLDPLKLKYVIEGYLTYKTKRSKVSFDTILTGSGQVTIRV